MRCKEGNFCFLFTSLFLLVLSCSPTQMRHQTPLPEPGEKTDAIVSDDEREDEGEGGRDKTGFRVFGAIYVHEPEEPVPGVKIEIRAADGMSLVNEDRNLTASTDEYGEFDIRISREGLFKMTFEEDVFETAGVLLHAEKGKSREVHITLEPRAPVTARIPVEAGESTAWVRVSDAQGRPVTGAEVCGSDPDLLWRTATGVIGRRSDPAPPPPPKPLTDERGEFKITGLEAGLRCVVLVSHPTLAQRRSVPFRIRQGEMVRLDIVLFEGNAVRGSVLDETGKPVQDASVRISCPRGDSRTVTSNHEGRFLVNGISKDGFFEVRAWKEGYRSSKTVFIEPGAEAELVLPSECVIEGVVLDAETKKPIGDAKVGWTRTVPPASEDSWDAIIPYIAEKDGSFLLDGLKPGTYRIEAEAQGYGLGSVEVVLEHAEHKKGVLVALKRKGR